MANEYVNELWAKMEDFNMTAEDVANLFLNYHGTQLLSDEFMQFIRDEGYTYEEEEEEE